MRALQVPRGRLHSIGIVTESPDCVVAQAAEKPTDAATAGALAGAATVVMVDTQSAPALALPADCADRTLGFHQAFVLGETDAVHVPEFRLAHAIGVPPSIIPVKDPFFFNRPRLLPMASCAMASCAGGIGPPSALERFRSVRGVPLSAMETAPSLWWMGFEPSRAGRVGHRRSVLALTWITTAAIGWSVSGSRLAASPPSSKLPKIDTPLALMR